jgi:hypothetical protein
MDQPLLSLMYSDCSASRLQGARIIVDRLLNAAATSDIGLHSAAPAAPDLKLLFAPKTVVRKETHRPDVRWDQKQVLKSLGFDLILLFIPKQYGRAVRARTEDRDVKTRSSRRRLTTTAACRHLPCGTAVRGPPR